MTGAAKFFAICWTAASLSAGAGFAGAQAPNGSTKDTINEPLLTGLDVAKSSISPVAQVRQNKSWEYGPFVNYGVGVGDRSQYKFLWAGVQLGKPLTPVFHVSVFSGQFEFAGNIMPSGRPTRRPRTSRTIPVPTRRLGYPTPAHYSSAGARSAASA